MTINKIPLLNRVAQPGLPPLLRSNSFEDYSVPSRGSMISVTVEYLEDWR
jgi:hypothetical protein